jgi:hypothetical protein
VKRTGFAPRKTPMKRSRAPSPQAIRIEPDAFKAVVKVKTRGDHLADLQDAFNAWIRLRDAGQPCISCGRPYGDRWHAGHYRSVGSEPSLRFEPDNVHLQCPACNLHLCGNQAPYRVNLVKKNRFCPRLRCGRNRRRARRTRGLPSPGRTGRPRVGCGVDASTRVRCRCQSRAQSVVLPCMAEHG